MSEIRRVKNDIEGNTIFRERLNKKSPSNVEIFISYHQVKL